MLLFITPELAVWDQAKLRARERAAYIAGEVARAGGQAIDPADAITGTAIPVDPKDAAAAAQSYLRSASVTGAVSVSGDSKTLTAVVNDAFDTAFLPVVGIGSLSVTGHGKATLLYGVTAPEGS
ncbi:hypothetical protein [Streptomyces chartreusis]|uniref:hypothetical protein n=1 Tax=Streptomyces chartreusis TaxID=1969 RepID=UPI002E193130